MEPIEILAILLFCYKASLLIELPTGMYLQCNHANYEMSLIMTYDEFLPYITEHGPALDDDINKQVLEYLDLGAEREWK